MHLSETRGVKLSPRSPPAKKDAGTESCGQCCWAGINIDWVFLGLGINSEEDVRRIGIWISGVATKSNKFYSVYNLSME